MIIKERIKDPFGKDSIMDYRTVLTNFRACNRQNADAWRASLGLSMPYDTLLYCAEHYRTCEKRDPSADELRMLDRLSFFLEQSPDALCPAEILTDDPSAASTYSDLLNKRRTLDPEASYPCTLTEAAKLSSRYLHYSGKKALPWRSALLVGDHCGNDTLSLGGSPFRLRPFSATAPLARTGDLLLLVTPQEGGGRTVFYKAAQALLHTEAVLSSLAGMWSIEEGGLLPTLLSITEGLWIDLTHLSPARLSLPMTVLTEQYAGCYVLRIPSERLQTVLSVGEQYALCILPFAKIMDGGEYRFSRSRSEKITLTAGFMKRLYHYRRGRAALPVEHHAEPTPSLHTFTARRSCRYLTQSAECSHSLYAENGLLISGALGSSQPAPFRTSLATALLPVLSLSAAGIPHTEQFISVGISIPRAYEDDTVIGNALSTVLGWYRASCECALAANVVTRFHDANTAELSVYAIAPGQQLPDQFTEVGKKVYCVAPAQHPDGTFDFPALRTLLSSLVHWNREGKISAARAFAGRSVTDILQEMRGDCTCRLENPKLAAEGALPLAILLESDAELPLAQIGTVVRTPKATLPHISNEKSLVWSEAPEILLLHQRSDRDAEALASILEERGAHVVCLSDDAVGPISRALLTAQTLILCRGAVLPCGEMLNFSLESAKRSGCRFLSLGDIPHSPADFVSLPKGLDPETIAAITFFEKNEKK